jgi:hypothetical protein
VIGETLIVSFGLTVAVLIAWANRRLLPRFFPAWIEPVGKKSLTSMGAVIAAALGAPACLVLIGLLFPGSVFGPAQLEPGTLGIAGFCSLIAAVCVVGYRDACRR